MLLLTACLLFCFSLDPTLATVKRPNIVVIVADDLGWGDVSFHGSKQVKTPDIDDLASDGIVLNNYYVSQVCTPSRGALLSGRHPIHIGLQHSVIGAGSPHGLPLQFDTLPQYLKTLGYATHAIGKWHLGHHTEKYLPTSRGFDTFFGYLCGHGDYYDHTSLVYGWWGVDLRRNMTGVAEQYIGQYSTTMFTNEAIEVINRHKPGIDKPFFLYLSHQAVHTGNEWSPFQVPMEFERRFSYIDNEGRRKMVAMGNALNDAVAQVFDTLKKNKLLDNTIIVFTTDNGGATGPVEGPRVDGGWASNWPLRGTKWTWWEGGIRAIGFVWSPLLKRSSYTYNGLMHISDWVPTLFAAAGGDVRTLPPSLYGMNLWPDLNRGTKSDFTRKEILHNIDDIENTFAIRSGDYKLKSGSFDNGDYDGWYLQPREQVSKGSKDKNFSRKKSGVKKILERNLKRFGKNPDLPIAVKCGKNKGTPCDTVKDKLCLFNISEDPCEYNNLANKLPSVVKQLLKMVSSYNQTAVEPGNKAQDPLANPALNGYYWGPWLEEL